MTILLLKVIQNYEEIIFGYNSVKGETNKLLRNHFRYGNNVKGDVTKI